MGCSGVRCDWLLDDKSRGLAVSAMAQGPPQAHHALKNEPPFRHRILC